MDLELVTLLSSSMIGPQAISKTFHGASESKCPFWLMNLQFLQLLLSGAKTVLVTYPARSLLQATLALFLVISAQQRAVECSEQPLLVHGQGEQLKQGRGQWLPARLPQLFPRADSLWSRHNLPGPASYLRSSIYVLTILNLHFSLEEEEIKDHFYDFTYSLVPLASLLPSAGWTPIPS